MSNRLKRALAAKTRPQRTVAVVLHGEIREQIEAVEDELDRLDDASPQTNDRRLSTKGNAARKRELEADLERLHEAAAEATVYLVLEALSDTAWLTLKSQHKPKTPEGEKPKASDAYAVSMAYNVDTIRRPLIKACVVGERERPEANAPITPVAPAELDELLDFVNTRQMMDLANAAYVLCERDDAAPLSRRRSQTPTSDDG